MTVADTDMQRLREALAPAIVKGLGYDALTLSQLSRTDQSIVSAISAAVVAVFAEEGWVAPEEVAALRSCVKRLREGWTDEDLQHGQWIIARLAEGQPPDLIFDAEPMSEAEQDVMRGILE